MPPLVVCVVSCALGAAPRRAAPVCRAVRCRVPRQPSSEPCAERAELLCSAQRRSADRMLPRAVPCPPPRSAPLGTAHDAIGCAATGRRAIGGAVVTRRHAPPRSRRCTAVCVMPA